MSSSKSIQPVRLFIRNSWQILIGILVGFFGLAYVAWGATYNFYFNNTEQGDNSTATPSVSVGDDGKVVKKAGVAGDATKPNAPNGDGGIPAAPESGSKVPAPSSVSAAESPAEKKKEEEEHNWRFAVGFTGAKAYGPGAKISEVGRQLEPSGSISMFFNRSIGLTVFGSALPSYADKSHFALGLEVEFLPIHISTSSMPNFFEVGLLGGVQTEYLSDGGDEGGEFSFRPEGGLRLALNIGRYWGIIADVRGNQDFATGEGALAFRL